MPRKQSTCTTGTRYTQVYLISRLLFYPMTSPPRVPEGGIPTVVSTHAGREDAARILAQRSGLIAIATDRASSFRYDDRALLLHLRRADPPIFLVPPEGIRDDVREVLAPVVNGEKWVVHAAVTDL